MEGTLSFCEKKSSVATVYRSGVEAIKAMLVQAEWEERSR